jgi:hypothetical protein
MQGRLTGKLGGRVCRTRAEKERASPGQKFGVRKIIGLMKQ